jgi:hypothetical protein
MADRLAELGVTFSENVEEDVPEIPEHLKILRAKEARILADIERLRKWGDFIYKLPHSGLACMKSAMF